MFGLSFPHLIVLGVLALIFIGPEQLPEMARTIARLLNEWKRTSSELQNTLTNTLRDDYSPAKPPVAFDHQDEKVHSIESVGAVVASENEPEKKS